MTKYRITRESLLDGSHYARVRAGHGPHVRFMTDEERSTHVAEIPVRAPRPKRIWVFGYGSLMWNPAFHYVEQRTARIYGFHRHELNCTQGRACPATITICSAPPGGMVASPERLLRG
jgi:cation transport protein ChaC